MVNKAFLCA